MTDLRNLPPDDEDAPRGVEVILLGPSGQVEVQRYTKALSDTVWLLTTIDRLAAQQAPKLRWIIADTSANGVLRARLTPQTQRPAATATIPSRALVDGLHALTERPEIPDLFTEASVQKVDRLGKPSGGVSGVTIAPISESGQVGEAIPVSEALRKHARDAIAPQERSVGSVVGVLDVFNARRKGPVRGSVFNPRTRHAVTCLIPHEQAPNVAEAFGRRVLVGGPLTRNELGQVIRIELAEFQVLPDDSRSPAVDEILGVDPGWTGDMTTDQYLARVRGA